jgi:hypothetical protein
MERRIDYREPLYFFAVYLLSAYLSICQSVPVSATRMHYLAQRIGVANQQRV